MARFKSFATLANIANVWGWLVNADIAINRSDRLPTATICVPALARFPRRKA